MNQHQYSHTQNQGAHHNHHAGGYRQPCPYEATTTRGCTRFTLRIKGTQHFPRAVVTAAVIPVKHLGTYRVVVTAGSQLMTQTVRDLCVDSLPTEQEAMDWARQCILAAHQFHVDCVGGEL